MDPRPVSEFQFLVDGELGNGKLRLVLYDNIAVKVIVQEDPTILIAIFECLEEKLRKIKRDPFLVGSTHVPLSGLNIQWLPGQYRKRTKTEDEWIRIETSMLVFTSCYVYNSFANIIIFFN